MNWKCVERGLEGTWSPSLSQCALAGKRTRSSLTLALNRLLVVSCGAYVGSESAVLGGLREGESCGGEGEGHLAVAVHRRHGHTRGGQLQSGGELCGGGRRGGGEERERERCECASERYCGGSGGEAALLRRSPS